MGLDQLPNMASQIAVKTKMLASNVDIFEINDIIYFLNLVRSGARVKGGVVE